MAEKLKGAGKRQMARVNEEAKERRARVRTMLEAGLSLQQIGDVLGVSKARAGQIVAKARAEAAQ